MMGFASVLYSYVQRAYMCEKNREVIDEPWFLKRK